MKAMILAAGRGERMRPLTDHTPKPLLKVKGKALIEYSLENLQQAGFKEIVINIAYFGRQIREFCGNGERWGLSIAYSDEGGTALETAGGIVNALPLLGKQAFLAINSDVICSFPLQRLRSQPEHTLAHLVMIDNPPHHPEGDFCLSANGMLSEQGDDKLTFSGIGVYHPAFFDNIAAGPLKLRPVLNRAMRQQLVSGEKHSGLWLDIGTPQRLLEINAAKFELL